ncbi:ATP-binding protein [Bifidobacterium eulemuris]|uniref:ATP-binding protein n=1 Tax=Bifidobacterium eulemuris TaxID=1765219 RepID=A0A261G409_9BIFI|nr:ATP-binding protein [Bifidobacterium eulemuris]OZG65933.1 ATPase (AAA+ superfamily) [Bifidobacterium eulemuris]QOL31999.1 ATP-binding protein [Bifidobacterium eulemuris]
MNTKYRVLRPAYLRQLEPYIDTEQVKVLQGVRRCGKSTILDMLRTTLLERGIPQRNIIHRRFDEFGLPQHITAQHLTEDLTAAFAASDPDVNRYVFLDEIQEVEDWETVVRGLHTTQGIDVYITGSNAHFLSSDLATLLAGRTIAFDIYPLSFAEYREFTAQRDPSQTRSNDELFADYLRFGGMPSLFSLRSMDEDGITRELSSIYNTVILKDVAERLGIRDIALLNRLVAYLFSTSGNLFSTRKVVGALVSSGRRTTSETVESYIEALRQAYILHEAPQFGLQGKQTLNPLRKFYAVDTGLRNMSTGFSTNDLGFQLENVVYNELLRRGWRVSVGTLRSGKEIDFIATKLDEREYIQVTETILDETTRKRELAAFQELHDAFPKTLLTLDRYRTGITEDGIRIINVVDWLLDK